MEQNSYAFATADLKILNNSNKSPPQYRHVVLEWSIDGGSCEEASRSASYACKENSYCYNSSNGIGYRCNCTNGFQGNPYLQGPGGCQDIDECFLGNPCTHSCINVKGGFNCTCPSGMSGNGRKDGSGCNGIGTLQISIVVGLALLLLLLVFSFCGCQGLLNPTHIRRRPSEGTVIGNACMHVSAQAAPRSKRYADFNIVCIVVC